MPDVIIERFRDGVSQGSDLYLDRSSPFSFDYTFTAEDVGYEITFKVSLVNNGSIRNSKIFSAGVVQPSDVVNRFLNFIGLERSGKDIFAGSIDADDSVLAIVDLLESGPDTFSSVITLGPLPSRTFSLVATETGSDIYAGNVTVVQAGARAFTLNGQEVGSDVLAAVLDVDNAILFSVQETGSDSSDITVIGPDVVTLVITSVGTQQPSGELSVAATATGNDPSVETLIVRDGTAAPLSGSFNGGQAGPDVYDLGPISVVPDGPSIQLDIPDTISGNFRLYMLPSNGGDGDIAGSDLFTLTAIGERSLSLSVQETGQDDLSATITSDTTSYTALADGIRVNTLATPPAVTSSAGFNSITLEAS